MSETIVITPAVSDPAGTSELAAEIAEHAEDDVERAHEDGITLGRLDAMMQDVQRRLGIVEGRTESAEDTAEAALEVAVDALQEAEDAAEDAAFAEVIAGEAEQESAEAVDVDAVMDELEAIDADQAAADDAPDREHPFFRPIRRKR